MKNGVLGRTGLLHGVARHYTWLGICMNRWPVLSLFAKIRQFFLQRAIQGFRVGLALLLLPGTLV